MFINIRIDKTLHQQLTVVSTPSIAASTTTKNDRIPQIFIIQLSIFNSIGLSNQLVHFKYRQTYRQNDKADYRTHDQDHYGLQV